MLINNKGFNIIRTFFLTLRLLFVFAFSVFAFDHCSAADVELTGYGATGFKMYDRLFLNDNQQETYFEGKFQLDIDINKKIDCQLDLRGNSFDNTVKFKEFSIKFKYMDYMKFKVGNIKKPFGFEYQIKREDLITPYRTNATEKISEIGFGGRNVTLSVYNEYKSKDSTLPISYNVSVLKNNSSGFSVGSRLSYHIDKLKISGSYLYQSIGEPIDMTVSGYGIDAEYENKGLFTGFGLYYVGDFIEGEKRRSVGEDSNVMTLATNFISSYKFDVDGEVIKKIEPFLLFSYYQPDSEDNRSNVIQAMPGVNFYPHKKVILRIVGDLRLTKNQFNTKYTTKESRLVLEVMACF